MVLQQYLDLNGHYEIQHRDNYGRDLGAFLWFVIHNYKTLSGTYIFSPANLGIHYRRERLAYMLQEPSLEFSSPARTPVRWLQRIFRQAKLHYLNHVSSQVVFRFILWLELFMPHDYNFTVDAYKGEQLTPSHIRPYGMWFENKIGPWVNGLRICCRNGQFITHASCLHARPIAFYQMLLKEMNTTTTSETVHFVERAAADIFG